MTEPEIRAVMDRIHTAVWNLNLELDVELALVSQPVRATPEQIAAQAGCVADEATKAIAVLRKLRSRARVAAR